MSVWRRWVGFVTLGELTGFLVPALVGSVSTDLPAAAQLLAFCTAGTAEGAMLGFAQAHVLRSVLRGFRYRAWVLATAGGAACAWLLGMLPSTTYGWWSTWPTPVVLVLAVPLGVLLLLSIGAAQALVLPGSARDGRRWVGVNALGWAAALTVFTLVATPWWQPGQEPWQVIGIGLVAGAAMAATMAATTGVEVLHLSRRP